MINLLVPDERVAPSLHLDARNYLLDGAFVPVTRERGDDLGVSGSVGRRAHLSRAFHDADRLLGSIRRAPRVRGDVMRADVGLLPSLAHTLENLLGVLGGAHVSQYGGEGGVGLEGWAMAVREEALELGPRLLGVDDATAGLSSHGAQLLGDDVHGPAGRALGALLALEARVEDDALGGSRNRGGGIAIGRSSTVARVARGTRAGGLLGGARSRGRRRGIAHAGNTGRTWRPRSG